MNRIVSLFLLTFLSSWLLIGCTVESAKSPATKQLVIASDYLQEGDSTLFEGFLKKNDVELTLINLPTDVLIQTLKTKEDNSNIDVLMVKSLHTVNRLSKANLLQNIDFSQSISEELNFYTSTKYNYVGFGIDPFVIAYESSVQNSIKNYNDLTREHFINKLPSNEYAILLSPILKKLKKVEANNWVKKFINHGNPNSSISDSLQNSLPILCTYNQYTNLKSDTVFDSKEILLPNASTSGSMYDLRSFCIVNQASNYSIAKDFILNYIQEDQNQNLNKKLKTLSIHKQSIHFRRYQKKMEDLIPYYGMVDRVIKKIK